MYEDIDPIETPDDDRIIWRYRSLEPEIRLDTILGGALYHSRLDQFQDEYEGRYPEGNHDPARVQARANYARERLIKSLREADLDNDPKHARPLDAIRERLEADGIQPSEDQLIESYIQTRGDIWAEFVEDALKIVEETARSLLFVNCWHLNGYESDLMWRAHDPERSVAIRSTIGGLKEALSDNEYDVRIGRVSYIDKEHDTLPEGNWFSPAVHKWVQYKHEEEARTIVVKSPPTVPGDENITPANWAFSAQPTGFPIKVDATKLIDEIRVSPGASDQTFQEVCNRCQQYGVNNVKRSVLTDSYN